MKLVAQVFAVALTPLLAEFAPPRVTVNLDEPPEHRWDHVVAEHKDAVNFAFDVVFADPAVAPIAPAARLLIGNGLEGRRLLPEDQYLEAKGIARGLGRPTADVVLITSFYDLMTAGSSPFGAKRMCTGIVAQGADGQIYHGRNMDYSFVDALGKATLVVDFARKNVTQFTAVTLGPNPGFNTVVRHGGFSASHNERDEGSILANVWDVAVLGRPVTFSRMRWAAEHVETFEAAVEYFSTTKLSAASYFVLGGTEAGEGAVITRKREKPVDVSRLDATAGRWYVLETNYDNWLEPQFGDNRRAPAMRAMNATGQQGINLDTLWDVLSIRTSDVNRSAGEWGPLNSDTVYSTLMQAAKPEVFKTMVRSHANNSEVVVLL